MKKTIASLAILASATSAYALRPNGPNKERVCLKTYQMADKSVKVASCDSTRNNKTEQLPLMENGCAAGQVALALEANVIDSCLPPGVVQL